MSLVLKGASSGECKYRLCIFIILVLHKSSIIVVVLENNIRRVLLVFVYYSHGARFAVMYKLVWH